MLRIVVKSASVFPLSVDIGRGAVRILSTGDQLIFELLMDVGQVDDEDRSVRRFVCTFRVMAVEDAHSVGG